MTTQDAPLSTAPAQPPEPAPEPAAVSNRVPAALVVGAAASLSAAAVHASAVGAHSQQPEAARAFTVAAFVQLVWAVAVFARPRRWLAAVGALVSAALVVAWIVAKTKGLSMIDGLNDPGPLQAADVLAASLAAVAAVAAAWAAVSRSTFSARPAAPASSRPGRLAAPRFAGVLAGAIVVVALPGMVEAGRVTHGSSTEKTVVVGGDGKARVVTGKAAKAVTPPKPFDPDKPIDLGGVPGVTPAQQARAENLLATTVVKLPQWSDPAVAEAAGFKSIGDGGTGTEHFINWSYITDNTILDPDKPESLVYTVKDGKRTLAAAMFMLKPGATLDKVPDLGGALTQWHIHDDLCFTNDGGPPRVGGLTKPDGTCSKPLVKLQPVPMIHVWITPQPCGPFSALEGIGAGQIKPGEVRVCDKAHGSDSGGL